MSRRTSFLLIALLLASGLRPLHAQSVDSSLTANEVEQLRDSAYFPDQRVLVYIGFLNDRTRILNDLFAKPRKPGREDDVHDLMQQFNAIAGELEDNLLDANQHHTDLRKVLPKLLAATERWSSDLKNPPDDPRYNLTRKLALDTVHDLHDDATDLTDKQKGWFAAHPPVKRPEDRPPQPYQLPDPK